MENGVEESDEDTRRLVVAIIDFLRDQLIDRTDLVPEDRDCLEIAIQSLEMAYGLEAHRYVQYRFSRPLLDVFNQVTNPVRIRDKLRADGHRDEGNSFMRRNMFSNAETEYTQAIELDRWNAIYYCNRASARIEQRNFFEAISDCRQALTLNPDYAKAQARMGQAYALIHRPREAARCFRQALELEPSNESYRNNLRVAESQITGPDAMGLITSLLSSIFGLTPRMPGDSSSIINLPPSFMIITESHPPVREEPDENDQTSENGTGVGQESGTEGHNIAYPMPFGVIDEGAEEQPILQIHMPDDMDDILESDEEFLIEIPGFPFFGDRSPPSLPSTPAPPAPPVPPSPPAPPAPPTTQITETGETAEEEFVQPVETYKSKDSIKKGTPPDKKFNKEKQTIDATKSPISSSPKTAQVTDGEEKEYLKEVEAETELIQPVGTRESKDSIKKGAPPDQKVNKEKQAIDATKSPTSSSSKAEVTNGGEKESVKGVEAEGLTQPDEVSKSDDSDKVRSLPYQKGSREEETIDIRASLPSTPSKTTEIASSDDTVKKETVKEAATEGGQTQHIVTSKLDYVSEESTFPDQKATKEKETIDIHTSLPSTPSKTVEIAGSEDTVKKGIVQEDATEGEQTRHIVTPQLEDASKESTSSDPKARKEKETTDIHTSLPGMPSKTHEIVSSENIVEKKTVTDDATEGEQTQYIVKPQLEDVDKESTPPDRKESREKETTDIPTSLPGIPSKADEIASSEDTAEKETVTEDATEGEQTQHIATSQLEDVSEESTLPDKKASKEKSTTDIHTSLPGIPSKTDEIASSEDTVEKETVTEDAIEGEQTQHIVTPQLEDVAKESTLPHRKASRERQAIKAAKSYLSPSSETADVTDGKEISKEETAKGVEAHGKIIKPVKTPEFDDSDKENGALQEKSSKEKRIVSADRTSPSTSSETMEIRNGDGTAEKETVDDRTGEGLIRFDATPKPDDSTNGSKFSDQKTSKEKQENAKRKELNEEITSSKLSRTSIENDIKSKFDEQPSSKQECTTDTKISADENVGFTHSLMENGMSVEPPKNGRTLPDLTGKSKMEQPVNDSVSGTADEMNESETTEQSGSGLSINGEAKGIELTESPLNESIHFQTHATEGSKRRQSTSESELPVTDETKKGEKEMPTTNGPPDVGTTGGVIEAGKQDRKQSKEKFNTDENNLNENVEKTNGN